LSGSVLFKLRVPFDLTRSLAHSVHQFIPSEAGHESGLLQLKQFHYAAEMYGDNYGYRSGLNQFVKRKARGYRSTDNLIPMLYFTAGKLRIPASH
jgi:hypothetical protein